MRGTLASTPTSIQFSLIDVCSPLGVARFIYWLESGRWPEKSDKALSHELTPQEQIEIAWGWQAPRQRMAKLLWQLLQGNYDEDYFRHTFTSAMDCLEHDSVRCREVLPVIQERLLWVLRGIEQVDREDVELGVGAWGDEWFLPPEHARFVRDQLARAHLDLLEQPSDYPEALEWGFDHLVRDVAKFVEAPLTDPDRVYVGEITWDATGEREVHVWVEANGNRVDLVHAAHAAQRRSGNRFAWGYGGAGPGNLALSLLADATDGDIDLAERYQESFLQSVVEKLTWEEPFHLSCRSVLDWLERQALGSDELCRSRQMLSERKRRYGPALDKTRERLEKVRSHRALRSQRFDAVPADFECALYVDLMEALRSGQRILRCNHCQLPLPYTRSGRSNRQRARWQSGLPVYHEPCWQEARRETKREQWRRRASDPQFREARKLRARELRRAR